MASRNHRKQVKPAKPARKAPEKARLKKRAAGPAKKPAKKNAPKTVATRTAKPAAKNKAAARRSGVSPAGRGTRGLIALGEVVVFGARYRVFAKPPELVRRELTFEPGDKSDIDVQAGGRIRWSAPLRRPFRIQFTGQPPDLDQPRALSFTSTQVSKKQRVEVTLRGHPPGARLDYDIYSPPDSAKPMDPSLIIYPNAELQLQLA